MNPLGSRAAGLTLVATLFSLGCSSDQADGQSADRAGVARPRGADDLPSLTAQKSVTRIARMFQRRTPAPPDVAADSEERSVAVLTPARVQRMQRLGADCLEPVVDPAELAVTRWPARVVLPTRADGTAEVLDRATSVSIGIRLMQGTPAQISVSDGLAVYEGGWSGGGVIGDVVIRPSAEGFEDYVAIERRPQVEELSYEVDVSRVAGLRVVASTVEFLDALGAPVLRMEAPYVLDSRGTTREASVALHGCDYDTSGLAPWGREVTAPGSDHCAITIAWGSAEGAGLEYPLLVDPAWRTTGSMTSGRSFHTLTKLQNGRVLAAGGYAPGGGETATAELYNPATETWASTTSMSTKRVGHTATLLNNGRVFVAGGFSGPGVHLGSSESYDPGSGTWALTGTSMVLKRAGHGALLIKTGAVMVLGGDGPFVNPTGNPYNCSEIFDGSVWGSSVQYFKNMHGTGVKATTISDGRVLVTGGMNGSNSSEVVDPAQLPSLIWQNTNTTMTASRRDHILVTLLDGRALAAGGQGATSQASAETLNPTTLTWTTVGSMSAPRHDFAAVVLPNGLALATGGRDTGTWTSQYRAEHFNPSSDTWTATSDMVAAHYSHAATVLDSGMALVSGGALHSAAAEVYMKPQGYACAGDGECQSTFCVDGFCCNSPCTGLCQACSAALKGSGADGACGVVATGTDPDNDCASDSPSTCQKTGLCDGAGACQLHAASTSCGTSCSNATLSNLICDGTGSCVGDSTSSCGLHQCASATACGTSCTVDSACILAAWCNVAQSACAADQGSGASCSSPSQCQSGYCVDGVCCDEPCAGLCRACSASKKGYGADGTCDLVASGLNVDNDCATEPPSSCGSTGACDGAGNCQKYPAGTTCAASTCASSVQTDHQCNGSGLCVPTDSSCGWFQCKAAGCGASCTVDAECVSGAWCDVGAQVCESVRPQGSSCVKGAECQSGFCVDGVCCNDKCTGQCEACNGQVNPGTCLGVDGSPVTQLPEIGATGRVDCSGAGTTCAGRCDSSNRLVCTYPQGTVCASMCASGAEVVSKCDNSGACVVDTPKSCGKYQCDEAAQLCKTSCQSAADCATGTECNLVTQQCAEAGNTCKDDFTVAKPGGGQIDCTPYTCAAGSCRDSCSTTSDCSAGYDCSAAKCTLSTNADGGMGADDPPSTSINQQKGCGCATPGSGSRAFSVFGGLGLLLSLCAIRSRRRSVM